MTGRERMEAALSKEGTDDVPATICYEGIYVRDHWDQLTDYPWWYRFEPDIDRQLFWRRDALSRTGQDWFDVPDETAYSQADRENVRIEENEDGVFRFDRRTGDKKEMVRPHWSDIHGGSFDEGRRLPATLEDVEQDVIDRAVGPYEVNWEAMDQSGSGELGARTLEEFGGDRYPTATVAPPLTSTFGVWGFQGMMLMVLNRPDLVEAACKQLAELASKRIRWAAKVGASVFWLEDAFTDMINADAFGRLNVPFVRDMVDEIRGLGLKSIYYYCGNPGGKWEHILDMGADALAFEESKKGFEIDVDNVVDRVDGRATVFGNMDAISVLQDGTEEELRAEISRQLAAGRRNDNRFVMCTGSPVTPGTPVERVRLYCDLVHELAQR